MTNAMIASGSLMLMLMLIWGGLHVAVVLGLVSFIGVWLIKSDVSIAASLLATAANDTINSHIFGVVPLFVLTGFLVAQANVGKDAFEVANQLFRRLRGGLGIATVEANAVFAAITGISIASTAVFTLVAVPQMLRFGYRGGFATSVVAGSSVLGMLIAPSLLMILYGFLSNQSVGDMFTAGIIPGLLLACAFALGIVLLACLRPDLVFTNGVPVEVDVQRPVWEQHRGPGSRLRKRRRSAVGLRQHKRHKAGTVFSNSGMGLKLALVVDLLLFGLIGLKVEV